MIARLAPWAAQQAGVNLLENPESLKNRIVKLAVEFSERYNVDVIAVVAHRETNYDLHLHIIFSETREVVLKKNTSGREAARKKREAIAKIRTDLKRQGKSATNKEVGRVYLDLIQSGALTDPASEPATVVEYRRFRSPQ